MNTRLISAAAVALTLAAGSAMAAGADGASFPSLDATQGVAKTRAEVQVELAQAQRDYQRTRFASADGTNGNPQYRVVVSNDKSRDAVRSEVLYAIRTGAIEHANTPY